MSLAASEVEKLAQGKLRGDPGLMLRGAAPLEKAGPSDLAFLADPALAAAAAASKAGCLLAPDGSEAALSEFKGAVVFTKNPKYAFMLALRRFEADLRPLPDRGRHPTAVIYPTAKIGADSHVGPGAVVEEGAYIAPGASIGAQCYIGRNAKVGMGTRLYPGVKMMDSCEIGSGCIIHAGTVIGSDGYGYVSPRGKHEKIPQIGKVVIEDDVEIGANCAVDRAALEVTLIGAGTKIDNLVHIAHNVRIGRNCLIMAQAAIAGSTEVGDNAIIGGQAGISDHVKIGENSAVMARTGIMSDLSPGQVVFGHIGRPRIQAMKIEALLSKLPEMHRTLSKIKKRLGI
ncbi:MAG: UDP-3-O-(3-hydroxymyristoyl)glucosamine N-acyltransferase [Elusimicrobia bacterium]|nr:UDP-3-O-(3-hydroxymyristoyl)glucosamine N-acyltransferase [Elusimicrobiota bacterium]